MNHPVTRNPKRRVVHPTAAEIRRATEVARRPDGSVSALAFAVALADPNWTREATPPPAPRPVKRAKR